MLYIQLVRMQGASMPRFSKEHSEATRARVLDAARSAFAAEGYAGVGLERIAAAAGATRGAV
ncbi:MAG TPA: TetR family transcriptional regulator, partial [Actinomycetes bacterium]|nr:TetR family transcriptional regulator [Actinomycetes bacterium]